MPAIRASIATSCGKSRRTSGSPPVSRTSWTPSRDSSRDQPLDLLEGEDLVALEPRQPLGRHAVLTAEVAAVGDRDAQVADVAAVAVDEGLALHREEYGSGYAGPAREARATASREDLGVAVDVGRRALRAHQRHVVERRDQHAAVERVQVQVALELGVVRGVGDGAVARRLGQEAVLGAAAELASRSTAARARRSPPRCPRRSASRAGSCARTPRRGACARASRASRRSRARCRRACRRRRRCPRSRRPGRRASARRASAVRPSAPAGTPPPIALPMTSMSGSRPQACVQPPGPAEKVCVSSMISSVPCLRVSSRSAVVVARRRAG